MLINENNRKQLIDFLINRWKLITGFAAMERVYNASYSFAKKNGMDIPQPPPCTIPHACLQIQVLKHRIIEILPEAHFIDYDYEAQAPLDPNDWVELFIADHEQCINKVQDIIEKMQVV